MRMSFDGRTCLTAKSEEIQPGRESDDCCECILFTKDPAILATVELHDPISADAAVATGAVDDETAALVSNMLAQAQVERPGTAENDASLANARGGGGSRYLQRVAAAEPMLTYDEAKAESLASGDPCVCSSPPRHSLRGYPPSTGIKKGPRLPIATHCALRYLRLSVDNCGRPLTSAGPPEPREKKLESEVKIDDDDGISSLLNEVEEAVAMSDGKDDATHSFDGRAESKSAQPEDRGSAEIADPVLAELEDRSPVAGRHIQVSSGRCLKRLVSSRSSAPQSRRVAPRALHRPAQHAVAHP